MKAEIIAVGTELLLGQIVNTNAQFIAQQCAEIGVGVYFQTVVGDNAERIRQAVETARGRADVLIFTGGLGPTQDDLTKDVLADYLGLGLVIHEPSMDKITETFRSRGIHMVQSNVRQAHLIEGGLPLPNETGLAVGNALVHDGTYYILLPGPPREMKPMFAAYAKPWLRSLMGDEMPLYSKMLKFAGIGESSLEHELLDLIEVQRDPTIAPYAKEGEVAVRLTTRAASEEEALAKMKETERLIHSRVGAHLYAEEDLPLEHVIVAELIRRKQTLTVAESCTGGLISDLITSIPGSSAAFEGGVISYSNELKISFLKVPRQLLEGEGAPGAISAQTAEAMAAGLLQATGSDYALSITGVAGPAESEGKPVGLVFIGLARRGQGVAVHQTKFSGNRDMIKLRAAKSALYQLWRAMKE